MNEFLRRWTLNTNSKWLINHRIISWMTLRKLDLLYPTASVRTLGGTLWECHCHLIRLQSNIRRSCIGNMITIPRLYILRSHRFLFNSLFWSVSNRLTTTALALFELWIIILLKITCLVFRGWLLKSLSEFNFWHLMARLLIDRFALDQ
jgi:hypothetical protein